MSIITQTSMPFICLPLDEFGISNLDKANSTYTEDNLLPGIPVATSVAGDHELFTQAEYNGITDSYTILYRIADDESGNIGGENAARFIWRDTSETTPANHWYGWSDYDQITDVWSINGSAGSASTQHKYPRAVVSRDNTLVTAYKYDSVVGTTHFNTSTLVRNDYKAFGLEAVITSENNSTSANDRVEADIVYVEEENLYYLFWISYNTAKTFTSIGVSVSDDGHNFSAITNGILPLDNSNCLAYTAATTPDTEIRRPRAIWNPISKTFTVAFQYHNGTDEYVYYVTTNKDFAVNDWTNGYQYRQCHDLVVDTLTGTEFLVQFEDNSNRVEYRSKSAGSATFSSVQAYLAEADFDTGVGIATWIGHNGLPFAMWADTTNEQTSIYQITSTGSLLVFDTITDFFNAGTATRLESISAVKYRDRILILGNPNASTSAVEDEILAIHLGGWANVPNMGITDTSRWYPWDLPTEYTDSISWSDVAFTGSGTQSISNATGSMGLLTSVTTSAGSAYYTGVETGQTAGTGVMKMQVTSGRSVIDVGATALNGYGYIDVTSWDGSQRINFRILVATTEFNIYDEEANALLTTDITLDSSTSAKYYKWAWDTTANEARFWYSSDGITWTDVGTFSLSVTASAHAAETQYEIGVRRDASVATSAYWFFGTFSEEVTAGDIYAKYVNYNYETVAYSDTNILPGMPISRLSNYVTKGLEVYATGFNALVKDHWTLNNASSTSVANALYTGPESPRIKWVTTTVAPTTLIMNWDFDEAILLGSGFIYIDSGPPIKTITVIGTDTGSSSRTLVNAVDLSYTLTADYTRRGEIVYPTSAGSSVRWFEKDELKGSYLDDQSGTVLYEIKSNTAGYWSSTNGDQRMVIILTGSVGGFSTSGSSLTILPKRAVVAWQNSDPFYAFDDVTVTLTPYTTVSTADVQISSLWLGRFKPLPVHPQAGRSRGRTMNHRRTTSPGGFGTGRILGPDARTRTFSVVTNEGSNKWTESSAVSSNTVSINGTDELVDAWSAYDTIQEVAVDYGRAKPIVWIDKVTTTPGSSGAVIGRFNRILIPCYMNVENIEVSATGPGAFDGEVLQVSTVQLVEIV